MTCNPLVNKDGKIVGFVCSIGTTTQCSVCGCRSTQLCDFPLRGAKEGHTCDRNLCKKCAARVAEHPVLGKAPENGVYEFCPAHARVAKRMIQEYDSGDSV